MEYEFTLVKQPHRGYAQFVHVDAFLDEPTEILRYSAFGQDYPSGVMIDMELHEEVQYQVTEVSLAEFERILKAWKGLCELSISDIHGTQFLPALGGSHFCLEVVDGGITSCFKWIAVDKDRTPFDQLIECLCGS